jgi:hypothetical protein
MLAADNTSLCVVNHTRGILNTQAISIRLPLGVSLQPIATPILDCTADSKMFASKIPQPQISSFFKSLKSSLKATFANFHVYLVSSDNHMFMEDADGSRVSVSRFGDDAPPVDGFYYVVNVKIATTGSHRVFFNVDKQRGSHLFTAPEFTRATATTRIDVRESTPVTTFAALFDQPDVTKCYAFKQLRVLKVANLTSSKSREPYQRVSGQLQGDISTFNLTIFQRAQFVPQTATLISVSSVVQSVWDNIRGAACTSASETLILSSGPLDGCVTTRKRDRDETTAEDEGDEL